jgi:two-component system nitrogen regulation sensor histidine kinase NtrY
MLFRKKTVACKCTFKLLLLKNFFKNKHFFIIAALLLFAVAHIFSHYFNSGDLSTVHAFEKTLRMKEHRLSNEMLLLAKRAENGSYDQLFRQKPDYYNSLLEKEGIALLIYESDTLKFWSDNSIAVENWIKEVCLDTKMAKLHNGWFEVMHPHTNSTTTKTIVGLVLIKNEFPYQNKYLTNEFQKDFSVPAETKLITDNSYSENAIKNNSGDYLFSLKFNADNPISFTSYLSCILNFIAFIIILLYFKKRCAAAADRIRKNNSIILFLVISFFTRYLTIRFNFPESFYGFDLFHPKIYADASSIWLSSLGDLLINILLLFYLSFVFYSEYTIPESITRIKKNYQVLLVFTLFLFYFWISWIITFLFTGLITNSSIPFSINNLFNLNIYSYISIVIIALLLFIYFLFSDKLVSAIRKFSLNKWEGIVVFVISASVHSSISHFLGNRDLIIIFWPCVILFLIVSIKQRHQIYPFSGIIFLVFLFSLYAVHVLTKYSEIKERESRKIYVEKIAAEQDPIAELLFQDVTDDILKDSVLGAFVSGSEKHTLEFEKRLRQQYFSGFWEKYDVHIALFDSMCVPVIKSQNTAFDNNLYFDELIANRGVMTSSPHFYSINNASGKISYLAKIPFLKPNNTRFGTLYIELDGKFISDEIGFPELLLDRNVGLSQELANYSYAKYKYNQLITQYGKYLYSTNGLDFEVQKNVYDFITKDGFDHLLYRPDPNILIVLSKRDEGLIGWVTTFSYLFAFFSLLLLSILFFRQLSMSKLLEGFSLKYRIQVLLVLIVLISLALFGGGTIYYIKQQFETKNRENISEKIHSVLMEVENRLGSENALNTDLSEYSSFIMKKLSAVFFTDINLYDAQGNLYASSRPKVFDEGLTSKKMNPEAYLQIAILGKTEFIHDERIGNLDYLSAFIPLKNKDGKLLAYLNLPYFAKQNELEKEISGFLVALINIYVLLFALSIITAIFISNYVTKPLKLIQDKLGNIKLGKTNEPIEWQENDEIGNLVSEYNRMIAELSNSADLLAKSEREHAWREMAKQVAHEIKNPLTPMKLSVQHLQRTWKDHAPDMDQKMERVTKTIIDQIDALSNIATEFSNFAKMPKANFEKINLQHILLNSISLFHDLEKIQLEFKSDIQGEAWILADKEQLLRVFNNLLKNAIQAIPENKDGLIQVVLKTEKNNYLVMIADNGIGINENIIHKIFVPNFTTKNGGMGLGLAMVKNIVENTGGLIWFETQVKKGTTFFVSLPSYKTET